MTHDEDETEYALVMPFVLVETHGGPYDDDAFTAGWACALIDIALQNAQGETCTMSFTVDSALVPQLDLIAMRHKFTMTADSTGTPPWITVRFDR